MAEVVEVQRDAFKANQRSKARRLDELSSVTKEQLPPRMKRAVIAAEEKGLRAGLLRCHWRILAFLYRRESFRMLSIFAMGGPHLDFLHSACVVTRLTLTTLCRAPTVVTLVYATTRSETFSENFSTRRAAMYALSLFSSQSMVSSSAGRPTPQTKQGWTSRLEDSGVETDMSAHILTFGCFTLMRAHIATAPWNNSTDRTSRTNAVTMKIVFETWRGAPSHLWCSLPLEVQARGYDVSQAAGWQGSREEEQQLCTDRGLASVSPVFRTPSSEPALPERIQTTEGVGQGRTSTAGSRHGWGLRVVR